MRERKYINIKECLNMKCVDILIIKSVNGSIMNIMNGIKIIIYNDETLYYSIDNIMVMMSDEKLNLYLWILKIMNNYIYIIYYIRNI